MATRTITSVLRQLRSRMNGIRERELAAALKRLHGLTPAQRAAVERLSKGLMTGFIHEPSARLRAVASNAEGSAVIDAARYLFALDQHRDEPRESAAGGSSGDVRAA